MRTSLWLLTSLFAVTLAGCSDDGSDSTTTTSATATATATMTATGTGTDGTGTDGTGTDGTTSPTTGVPTTDATTADTTTDATTDGTSTTGQPVDLSCENYCDIYKTACVDVSEYDNDAACLAQCNQWPVGEANATGGDSLGCRLYHVTVASTTDPLVHCPHAGPSGDGVCVDAAAPTCDAYCSKYFANCTADLNLYNDMADCMTQCAAWYPGNVADAGGDTVGCRLYHAGAAMADAMTHCPHAGPGGGGVCVTQ